MAYMANAQVILEAVRGSTYLGDIAVDDITLSSGPCAGQSLSLCMSVYVCKRGGGHEMYLCVCAYLCMCLLVYQTLKIIFT